MVFLVVVIVGGVFNILLKVKVFLVMLDVDLVKELV